MMYTLIKGVISACFVVQIGTDAESYMTKIGTDVYCSFEDIQQIHGYFGSTTVSEGYSENLVIILYSQ